jgi:hypothetical protein
MKCGMMMGCKLIYKICKYLCVYESINMVMTQTSDVMLHNMNTGNLSSSTDVSTRVGHAMTNPFTVFSAFS